MRLTRLITVLLPLMAGCGVLDSDRPRDQLKRAMAKWAQANLTSYDYVVQRLCFCPSVSPIRVTVIGGQVVARIDTTTGLPVAPNQASLYPDVAGLFALVEDAYDRADAINVTFDQAYGFPTSAVIDYVKDAIDDELTLSAADFHTPVSQTPR